MKISIIIPALNEEVLLPADSFHALTKQLEIVRKEVRTLFKLDEDNSK